jgi:rare lipoprotein A
MKNKINNAARLATITAIALCALGMGLSSLPSAALAKKPGVTYCFNGICHRVKTIEEVKDEIGKEVTQRASFYDDCKVDPGNPCTPLSSGEEFHADRPDNAASPVYPNGTLLALANPRTNATALVRINNSGPYFKGRLLDVSRATAVQLGFLEAGTAQLTVTVVPEPEVTAIVAVPTLER